MISILLLTLFLGLAVTSSLWGKDSVVVDMCLPCYLVIAL